MELTITSMTPADRLYAYNQSSQLEGQTGCIGHLRGDFGAGKEFYTSWFDHRREYKTDEFKAELDEVVNTLREKNGLLCTRDSMTRFCYQNPEAEFEGNYCAEYGFKVQTPQHTYMLRCNPNYGDYNFYLYAYVSRFLEHHMEKAKQGIRFITPGYKELFRIPDGDHIRIFTISTGNFYSDLDMRALIFVVKCFADIMQQRRVFQRPVSYLRICGAIGANSRERDPAAFFSAGAVF